MPKSARRVLKNSFFQVIGAFGITGLNFVLMLGYAHILGPESFGSLVTSQAQVLIWTMLVELGLSHSLIGALTAAESERTDLSRQGFRARDLLYRVLGVRLLGASIGSAMIYLLAKKAGGGEALFFQNIAFVPFLFAQAIQQTAVSFAMYRQRQGLSVITNLIGIGSSVALALFLAWQGYSISYLLLAQSWGGFLTGGLLFGYFTLLSARRKREGTRRLQKNMVHRRGAWGGEAWTALVQDAWPYAITFGVFVIWQRLDQIAASHLLGFEQGGHYALAVRLVAIPLLVATSISFAIFPDLQRVGRDAPDRLRHLLSFATKIIWRFGVIVSGLALIAVGQILAPLLPKFQPAIKLLPFFVPGVWAFWMQSFLVNALFGLRKYRLVVEIHLYSLAVYLPCLYFLTKHFELYGVVASFSIFCFAMCFFGFRAAKKGGIFPSVWIFFKPYTKQEMESLGSLPGFLKRFSRSTLP
jgi:O-antigen/teichoic acid export membrane protein